MDTDIVFKRVIDADYSRIKNKIKLVNVFLAIDGQRSVKTVAREENYKIDELISMVEQLIDLGLVMVPHDNSTAMDSGFFDFLSDELAKELGPMGKIVLEDALGNLGFKKGILPKGSLQKLIDRLSQEMGDARKADNFKKTMAAEIQKMN